jgi:hypothetical protein
VALADYLQKPGGEGTEFDLNFYREALSRFTLQGNVDLMKGLQPIIPGDLQQALF